MPSRKRKVGAAATFLVGPVFLRFYYNPRLDKRVCVFGEFHGQQFSCSRQRGQTNQTITAFIEQILANTTSMVDIFLESPYVSSNYTMTRFDNMQHKGENHQLVDLYRLGRNCLITDKSRCPWPNARWHSTDIRSHHNLMPFFNLEGYPWGVMWPLHMLKVRVHDVRGLGSTVDLIEEGLTKYTSFQTNRDWQAVDHAIKIDRQIARVSDKKCKAALENLKQVRLSWALSKKEVRALITGWRRLCAELEKTYGSSHVVSSEGAPLSSPQWERIGGTKLKKLLDQTGAMMWQCFKMLSSTMDLYTGARMLRMDDAKSSIFYGGTAHANPLSELLEEAGFSLVFQSDIAEALLPPEDRPEIMSCLDMRGLPDPLFG